MSSEIFTVNSHSIIIIIYFFDIFPNSLNQWLLILLDLFWPNFYLNQIQFPLEVKKDRYSTVVVYLCNIIVPRKTFYFLWVL